MIKYLENLGYGLWAIVVVLDKLINAITFGHYDETLSSRMGKYVRAGRGWFPCQICKLLNLFDQDHCEDEIDDSISYDNPSLFKNVVIWLLYFVPALAIELLCYVLAPVLAIFVTYGYRTDVVKRLNKQEHTLLREYLIKPLYWFQTHDNAVDEWWYGMYNVDHWFEFARNWTQEDYDNSPLIRYYCRVMWLWRNCAYGFHYNLFSRAKEYASSMAIHGIEDEGFWYQLQLFESSFQLEAHIPVGPKYISINIGWKAHKNIPRLLYANRIFSLRSYK